MKDMVEIMLIGQRHQMNKDNGNSIRAILLEKDHLRKIIIQVAKVIIKESLHIQENKSQIL